MEKLRSPKELEEEYLKLVDNIARSTPVDDNEPADVKVKRIAKLEADPEEWISYYFPRYAFARSAKFQVNATKRIVKAYDEMVAKGHGKFYGSRMWARGLSKSTRRMLEVFYLMFAKGFTPNCLLISKTESNAIKLLKPYRANLEANQRIIADYGEQKNLGSWESHLFITKKNATFAAVGAEQNPRGARTEEMRVNCIIFDDVDDDERSRNPDRVQECWDWVEKAVIPTVEIARPYFIFFDNNKIAEDSLAERARQMANDKDIVNIRDEQGKSTWPEKNTEEMIDEMINSLSYANAQGEYFNNPMSTGKTFPEITWGACPPLRELQFVVVYADPATSNKDRPGQKSNLSNSRKAVFVVGRKDKTYYVYTGFLDVMSNSVFIASFYACRDYINKACPAYFMVENNTLQDPFYEQVLLKLVYEHGRDQGSVLPITPDTRKKPEKWFRIESVLEPLNRMNRLIFNKAEQDNPHMKRLEAQFKSAKPTSKELDGPDCIEGAVWIIDQKTVTENASSFTAIPRSRNSSKYY
jgi:hypothetical protein